MVAIVVTINERSIFQMNKLLAVSLLMLLLSCVLTTANANRNCYNRRPRVSNCFRADHLWYFNGRWCVKLPVMCYDVQPRDNAFSSQIECNRACSR